MKQKTHSAPALVKSRTGAQGRHGGHLPGQSKKHQDRMNQKAQEGRQHD